MKVAQLSNGLSQDECDGDQPSGNDAVQTVPNAMFKALLGAIAGEQPQLLQSLLANLDKVRLAEKLPSCEDETLSEAADLIRVLIAHGREDGRTVVKCEASQ